MPDRYYRGQGSLYISDRDPTTGQPVNGFRFLGNVPSLKISTSTQQIKHQESYTGQSLTDLVIETTKEAQLMLTLESFEKDNLTLALFGTSTTIAGATVSGETLTVYRGKQTPVANINLTSFTSLTSIAATPVNYVNGTDYTINLKTGMLSIPTNSAIASGTQVRANYVAGTHEKISAFTRPNREYWLRFDGLNSAEGDNPIVVDIYRARFNPQKEWNLIGNELSSIELDAEILYDFKQSNNTADGRFFRERQVVG